MKNLRNSNEFEPSLIPIDHCDVMAIAHHICHQKLELSVSAKNVLQNMSQIVEWCNRQYSNGLIPVELPLREIKKLV